MAGGERQRGRVVEDLANLEVLEMGTVGDDPLARFQLLLLDVTAPASRPEACGTRHVRLADSETMLARP